MQGPSPEAMRCLTKPKIPAITGTFPSCSTAASNFWRPALTRNDSDGNGAVLIDATLGAGGHAERFLTEFPALRLIGLDRDPNALWIAGERLSRFGDRVLLVRTRYDGIEGVLAANRLLGKQRPSLSTASSSTSACPRCNSTAPSAASPTPRTHPWI